MLTFTGSVLRHQKDDSGHIWISRLIIWSTITLYCLSAVEYSINLNFLGFFSVFGFFKLIHRFITKSAGAISLWFALLKFRNSPPLLGPSFTIYALFFELSRQQLRSAGSHIPLNSDNMATSQPRLDHRRQRAHSRVFLVSRILGECWTIQFRCTAIGRARGQR